MSFERTSHGMSNVALFYGVNQVVYVEGKPQNEIDDIGSLDLIFWSVIFRKFLPDLSVKIICKGSKRELLEVAHKVISGDTENVIIGLDRDYDFERGDYIDHRSVLYTYGYSWENDVWQIDVITKVIDDHALIKPLPTDLVDKIYAAYEDFVLKARRLVFANIAAQLLCDSSVVASNEQKGLVCLGSKELPCFNSKFFKQRLHEFNRLKNIRVSLGVISLDPQRQILGHLIAHFGYHLICASLNGLGQSVRVNFEFMSTLVVNTFSSLIDDLNGGLYSYYDSQMRRIAHEFRGQFT